jgi:uncharacterized membrane protein YphA (DoxX/SURF4 family)
VELERGETTLRIIIALVFFVHGVGHVMGIVPAVGLVHFGVISPRWCV